MELGKSVVLEFPCRWVTYQDIDRAKAVSEIDSLATVLVRGCEAVTGVYMRLCDLVRNGPLSDLEVRKILGAHFPRQRVSEIIRVSKAPEHIYNRYTAGFFGFKSALRECRAYTVTPNETLRRRQIRRAIGRLIALADAPAIFQHGERTIEIR